MRTSFLPTKIIKMKAAYLVIVMMLVLSISSLAQAFSDPFTDTNTAPEYNDALLYFADAGIIQGYTDGTVRLYDLINRAEMTKILVEGNGITPDVNTYNYCFQDAQMVIQAKNM